MPGTHVQGGEDTAQSPNGRVSGSGLAESLLVLAEHEHPHGREPGRHHRHLVRKLVVVLVGLIVVAVAVVLLSYAFRSHPGAKSLKSAAKGFFATTTTVPTTKGFKLPPAGVYSVTGSGTEAINKPPNSETDSPVMPVSVSYAADGCWWWHIDYNTAAWHEYEFCPKGKSLLLVAQQNYQAWNFGITSVTNLAKFTCSPPSPIVVQSPTVGHKYRLYCVGTNTAVSGQSVSTGPVTIVGVGTLRIGGVAVKAIHITRDQKITGSQTGQLDESWWFDAGTGMPLQASRNYRLVTNSPIGEITYTEEGSWRLTSLTPRIS